MITLFIYCIKFVNVGTVYQPYEPILFQSLANPFIFRCVDGVLIDGKDTGLSRMIYRYSSYEIPSKAYSVVETLHNTGGYYGPVHTETFSCIFVLFTVLKGIENNQLITLNNTKTQENVSVCMGSEGIMEETNCRDPYRLRVQFPCSLQWPWSCIFRNWLGLNTDTFPTLEFTTP